MDMFDEALSMNSALKLSGLTQSGLASQMGVSQSYVANKLRLLSFSDEIRKRIKDEGISERHARALLRLKGDEDRRRMIDKIKEGRLTVRECEALVDSMAEVNLKSVMGIKEKRERVNAFISSVKKSLDSLSALGIDTDMRKSYYGRRTYITLIVEDEL